MNGERCLKPPSHATDGKILVRTIWDLIDVDLYDYPRYKVKKIKYYLWGTYNKSFHTHHILEEGGHMRLESLDEYIKHEMLYIDGH